MNLIETATTLANPYLLYIKIAAVAAVAGLLIWAGIWFKGVLDERATLKANAEAMAKQVMDANHKAALAEAAQVQYQQTIKEVVDAVRKIKIQSNNYISQIDTAPPPAGADGDSVLLVPGGMPDLDKTLALFTGYSSGRAAAGAQTGSSNQAR